MCLKSGAFPQCSYQRRRRKRRSDYFDVLSEMRPLNNHGTTTYYSSSVPGTGTYLGAGAYSNTSAYSGAGVASSAGGQVPQGATSNTVRKMIFYKWIHTAVQLNNSWMQDPRCVNKYFNELLWRVEWLICMEIRIKDTIFDAIFNWVEKCCT